MKHINTCRTFALVGSFALLYGGARVARAAFSSDVLERNFVAPPAAARPWVYWFWLNGNISKTGITADLEAMQRVGIGGVLIMEVDQGVPAGAVKFGSPQWRELFQFVCSEAHRLGLEVNMNNDAGWNGSGGPWVTPELSMQKAVWTETSVTGGAPVEVILPQPEAVRNYYRDSFVLAFPTLADDNARIADIAGKSGLVRQEFAPPSAIPDAAPDAQAIPRDGVVDVTGFFKNGRLTWNAPSGNWTVLRLGHTTTGAVNAPAPASGTGLESDKFSRAATDTFFAGLMGKLIADNGARAGKTLIRTHIDSWESGSQNWTPTMRADFLRLRGYDPLPYLPVLTGRVVGNNDISERFLWDYRETLADLLNANYADRMRVLAQQSGLRLSIEAYGNSASNDMSYAGRADEPMGEFWASPPFAGAELVTEMASAAHTYGKNILGAEAFTSDSNEKWQKSPADIKTIGDWALCEGVNRMVVHRYAMQPYSNIAPGVSMGPWGLHYERTQTWWNQSTPWHTYLARCQYLLRQGLFVADVAYLQQEGAPRHFQVPAEAGVRGNTRPGYNFDGCTPEVVLTRMTVKNGRLTLPDGMNYRVLSLPDSASMTLPLLKKISQLVEEGATVVGAPPQRAPGLSSFPQADAQVRVLAARLWGNADGKTIFTHRLGKGRVVWGKTATRVLADDGVAEDFNAGALNLFRFIHRRLNDGTDIYFVANRQQIAREAICTLRSGAAQPELWWPKSGKREPVAVFTQEKGVTKIPLHLDAAQSVFLIFPAQGKSRRSDAFVSATRDGAPLVQEMQAAPIAVSRATYGVPGDAAKSRDVLNRVQALLAQGTLDFPVTKMAEGDDPAFGVVKTLTIDFTVDGKTQSLSARDGETVELSEIGVLGTKKTAEITTDAAGNLALDAWQSGLYRLTQKSGERRYIKVPELPQPRVLAGSWDVIFPPNLGAPPQATFERLTSWSERPETGIKYFSGTATYRKTFEIEPQMLTAQRRLQLDLGEVSVMAQVKLNGKDLGVLWKAPYRVDVSDALRPGTNTLEIAVTNLWINRMIGDEQLPEDSERNADGTLKAWPQWVLEGKPSPTGRFSFTTWRLWGKNDPLQPSGLIGPVTLVPAQRIVLR